MNPGDPNAPPRREDKPAPVIPIQPVPAAANEGETVWLYERQAKIYPRSVSGWFA